MEKSFSDMRPSYSRNIGSTLSFLDKVLCEFEELARGREIHSTLYTESNRLLPEQSRALLSEIARMRSVLAEVKEMLDLEAHVQNAGEFIWSQCSGLWASLSEIDSKRLKGYGGAPAGFAEYWDPKLLDLKESINRILDALRRQ